MFGTLFETQADRDTEARMRAVQHAYDVIRGDLPAGPKPSRRQTELLRIVVERQGRVKAIAVGELAERLRCTPRDVKGDVRDLRLLFRVRIGSSRDAENGGCYLITTKDEALDTARPFVKQAQAEFAVAKAILEPHEMKELEGQLRLAEEG